MGLISRVSSRTYSFRARTKTVPKERQETLFFLGSFQRVLLSKMGKSHSRPEQFSNTKDTTNGSNLTASKQHSASKNSVVSESEIKIHQQNGSRLASNTSQQTIKEAVTSTCETTQAITNNANVNTQLPNDHAQTVAVSAQNIN